MQVWSARMYVLTNPTDVFLKMYYYCKFQIYAKEENIVNPFYPSPRLSNFQYITNLFFLFHLTLCHQIILKEIPGIILFIYKYFIKIVYKHKCNTTVALTNKDCLLILLNTVLIFSFIIFFIVCLKHNQNKDYTW